MSASYGKYKNARNSSWQCLLDNRVSALPVPVARIAQENGIRLGTYAKNATLVRSLGLEPWLRYDAFSALTSTGIVTLYRDDLPRQRIRFTLAHELGHIFLGHLSPTRDTHCSVLIRSPDSTDPLEREANMFAARLLAPACVLWGIGARSAEEISFLCDISMQAAIIRAHRMDMLYHRESDLLASGRPSCFLSSALERQLYRTFQPFISEHKIR